MLKSLDKIEEDSEFFTQTIVEYEGPVQDDGEDDDEMAQSLALGTGTGFSDFVADSDMVKSRQPLVNLCDFLSLAPVERLDMRHLLRHWVKIVDDETIDACQLTITSEHRQRFGDRIFDAWSSSQATSELPSKPQNKSKHDHRIQVSCWKQDLPLSGTKAKAKAKRKRSDEEEEGDYRLTHRKKGKPAFIAVNKTTTKGVGKVSFEYKDELGQLASSEFVGWDHPLSPHIVKTSAVLLHDTHEGKRVRDFSEKLIITQTPSPFPHTAVAIAAHSVTRT
ncbi:hypothetical protein ACLX1H_009998 [Fusarium chlamydosporum]